MARTRRRLSRSCKYKIRYENETAAMIALRVLSVNKGYEGKPYECNLCGAWHVGGRSKKRMELLRRVNEQRNES